ncbi:MAG: M48 family metallopeptidase [Bacteroidetes bacterium]|nr:M48 family metallopeptidase [Bacteroidota bacterium]
MKKSFLQGLITILLFFATWYALTQINWMNIFKVQQVTDKTEQKLGELFWEVFKNSEKEIKNTHVVNSVDCVVTHICKSNKIDRSKLKIHVLDKGDINAFALPNGHLIIFSGLILNSDNQEELAGVICHEIAHIELNHVMKKLVKEIGLSVLISMTTGSSGAEVIKETAKMLSSSAFDRSLEKEADIKAVDYLVNANLNPEPFADFLYKLSETEHEVAKYLTWISTHPDSKERAEYIIEYGKGKKTQYKPVLSIDTWDKLKTTLKY